MEGRPGRLSWRIHRFIIIYSHCGTGWSYEFSVGLDALFVFIMLFVEWW